MFYSSRSLKPDDPYGNCCAGDRRLRRKQGAGAGAAVAEGKPCVGAQPDAYPQPDKARVRHLCWCRTSGPFYWPLFAACLFRNQRCALVFASRLRGIARHNRAGKKLQWTVFRAREIPRAGRTWNICKRHLLLWKQVLFFMCSPGEGTGPVTRAGIAAQATASGKFYFFSRR